MTQDNTGERLDALDDVIDAIEDANPGPEQKAAKQAADTEASQAEQGAREWGMVMFMLGGVFCMVDPRLKPVYSEERCLFFGQQAHVVAEKHGIGGMKLMPEIALLACILSFAAPTFFHLRETIGKLSEPGATANTGTKLAFWWRQRKAAKAAKQAAQRAAAGAASGGN